MRAPQPRPVFAPAALAAALFAGLVLSGASPASAQPLRDGDPIPPAPPRPAVQQDTPHEIPFRLRSDTIEVGVLRPSAQVERTFEVFNASRLPVTLTRVTGTCTCVGGLPGGRQSVPSGEVAQVSVTLKARPNPGPVSEIVTIWYLDPETGVERNFSVTVVGEIALAVKADPFFINLLGERTGTIRLTTDEDRPFRVLSAGGGAPVYDLRGYPEGEDPDQPRRRHAISFNFTDVPDSDIPQFMIIETDHPEAPIMDLRIIHRGMIAEAAKTHPWALTHDRVILGAQAPGAEVEFTMAIVNVDQAARLEATLASSALGVEVIEVNPDRDRVNYGLRFTVASDAPAGLRHERLTLSAGGVEKTISVFVRVERQ